MSISHLDVIEALLPVTLIKVKRSDLTLSDFTLLFAIIEQPRLKQLAYAKMLGINSASRISRMANKLLDAGLIESTWNPENPVAKMLKPTKEGSKLAKAFIDALSK